MHLGPFNFPMSSFVEPFLVLIEYVPHGDLLGYLRKSRGLHDTYFKDPDIKPQTSLTSQQLMKFAWQVADGMQYLSSRSVSWLIVSETYRSSERYVASATTAHAMGTIFLIMKLSW